MSVQVWESRLLKPLKLPPQTYVLHSIRWPATKALASWSSWVLSQAVPPHRRADDGARVADSAAHNDIRAPSERRRDPNAAEVRLGVDRLERPVIQHLPSTDIHEPPLPLPQHPLYHLQNLIPTNPRNPQPQPLARHQLRHNPIQPMRVRRTGINGNFDPITRNIGQRGLQRLEETRLVRIGVGVVGFQGRARRHVGLAHPVADEDVDGVGGVVGG